MITQLLTKLHGSAYIAASLRGQRRTPYLPKDQIDSTRDRRIREIVAYAAAHVPYYRDYFARQRIDPASIVGATELDRLPVLDKSLVRSQPKLFIADAPAARGALSFLTSGSTGTPIEVHVDRRALLSNIAYGEREREPVNQVCGGSFRPKELYVGYETSTFKKVIAFYEQSVLFPVRPRRKFVSLRESPEAIAAIANEERPDILVGYGGWVDLFFKTIAARGIRLHAPKVVMYIGEALPPGAREFIETNFGSLVMSRYNAVESFKIGYFCEHRTGFHIHQDICHVRIAGPDGATLAPGESGRVIVTNLINRASVLLNYPIGDIASMPQSPCPCGRTFALLSELEGRVEDLLPRPGGQFVHPRSVWQIFKDDREIIQYQLTQHELQQFELTLVTVDDATFTRAIARALPPLQRLLGDDAHIDARRESDFVRQSGRKFRAVASLCPRTGA